jgi:membrane protein DedA with SNARE-associated domain
LSITTLAAIFSISSGLGYLLPAVVGLESMGIPSPGETALVLAAVLASQGKLQIWLVIVIGVASAIVGDNIGYWLGRWIGRDVLEHRGPLHKHRLRAIEAGDRFFNKHGAKAVFLGRWVALVRVAAAWLAGINRMPFLQFFLWNALGGVTWGVTVGLAGYFAGNAATHVISQVGIGAAIGFGVLLIAVFVFYKVRERRRARQEEEDASRSRSSEHELMQ